MPTPQRISRPNAFEIVVPATTRAHLRDVLDHALRVVEQADGFRQLLENILSVNLTLETKSLAEMSNALAETSNAQNEEVRKISAWAAILFAPTIRRRRVRDELQEHARADLGTGLSARPRPHGVPWSRPVCHVQATELDLSTKSARSPCPDRRVNHAVRALAGTVAVTASEWSRPGTLGPRLLSRSSFSCRVRVRSASTFVLAAT